jgi:hypothetical protein
MGAVWIVGAVVVAVLVATVARLASFGGKPADIDLGPVSDGWLSQQRARKDS